ncbi:MAG: aldehyde dehydrogenase [Lachnospiraceae bacterium]|nr:aldehyde dehydrogenase [Lachnospiraceae bacterium]
MVKEKETSVEKIVAAQRTYFGTGATFSIEERRRALRKLKASIKSHEAEINAALAADLGKSTMESYMCEVGLTLSELGYMERHLKKWSRPHRVATPLAQFHASSFTVRDPYGVVLIMSPWNYPFLLTMEPLIGAIACGNCCVVKPSAYSPATSAVMGRIISECFPPEFVTVVEGGREENKALLDQTFDYIFFTGGVTAGKEVMRHAAEHLTPLTLELGGKSPCVVTDSANLKLAAKRLAFGKVLNCGQTCVAPDYLLIDKRVENEFLGYLKDQIQAMVGADPFKNDDYVHMINEKHFDRVMGLIDPAKVYCGGKGDRATLRIQPTILQHVVPEDAVMQEEIFGPVLPVMTYDNIEEVFAFIKSRPHPLAAYLFTQDKALEKRFLREVTFGGGCINDTIIHLATSEMGFGGVGGSGMGSYHGKKSFDTFSHEKSIVKKYTWMDMPVRYAPYTEFRNKLLRLFLK